LRPLSQIFSSMRDIILFVQKSFANTNAEVKEFGEKRGTPFRIAVLYDETKKHLYKKVDGVDIELWCNFDKPLSIDAALMPYMHEFAAVTCRWETYIHKFANIIPHVPYVKTPTQKSLLWSVDKIMMRKKFAAYDKKITPKFMVIKALTDTTFAEVREKIGFPVVIKPAGLAQSLLVSVNYHEEEFRANMKKIFKEVQKVYKDQNRSLKPEILVEQFLEGQMYSIDAYVTSRGTVTFCPPVYVRTGKAIGFDDFFGYLQLTPTRLEKDSIAAAESVVKRAIHSLGLRSTTVHAELVKTDGGWKMIELGPRIGGYRDHMYKSSFGIQHDLNDILVRLPAPVKVSKKVKGYSAAMKFFARKEGTITAIKGIRKIQKLDSYVNMKLNKKVGDKATFAKHGGICVFDIRLFNEDRSHLFADIRRIEQAIDIQTKK